jgi:hypothetical protein
MSSTAKFLSAAARVRAASLRFQGNNRPFLLVKVTLKPYLRTCWHTFSAFWLRSSVVSVLISMTTDMLPIGSKSVIQFFLGLGCCWLASAPNFVASVLHFR